MNIESMPLIGFEFFREQFVSQNKKVGSITDFEQSKKKKKKIVQQDENLQDDDPTFYVVFPLQLTNLDIIWKIALENNIDGIDGVIDKSIGFLINCYLSLDPRPDAFFEASP